MKRTNYSLILLFIASSLTPASTACKAQKVAIKSNILMDAMLSPNVGVEVEVAPQWTMDITTEINTWTLSHQKKWKHWYLQPEARRWLCNSFAGHFVGFHIFGGEYNIGNIDNRIKMLGTNLSRLSNTRYQGWMAGTGISYGYDWILGKHWNAEGEIGFGWAYSRYNRYQCSGCGKKIESGTVHNYVGPTKAAVNLIYIF